MAKKDIPNLLTMLRVVLAVGVFALLMGGMYRGGGSGAGGWREGIEWRLIAAAGLFVAAAVTDGLDGFLARRWKVVSAFGRVMDPFADKLLVLGTFVLLAGPMFWCPGPAGLMVTPATGIEVWMVIVIMSRELLVTSIRGVLEGQGIAFPATMSGKLKMIVQSVVIPFVLVVSAVTTTVDWSERGVVYTDAGRVCQIAAWVTVVITAWSALPYVVRGAKALKSGGTA